MIKHIAMIAAVVLGAVSAYPKIRVARQSGDEPLGLPSNATSIRSSISDMFTCEQRNYGYYADVDNDCQVFHVCLPVQFADGREQTFKWSFICPEETVFNQNKAPVLASTCLGKGTSSYTCRVEKVGPTRQQTQQESFTCTRPEDAVECAEAPQYYGLNDNFGQTEGPLTNDVPQ